MNFHGGQFNQNGVIDFSVNVPTLKYPAGFDELLKESLLQINKYPEIEGMASKNAIARYNKIELDQIVIGNGATELIYLMSRAMNFKVATIIQPTFTEYNRALIQNGVEVHHYLLKSENNFIMDQDKLIEHLDQTSSDLLVICNPNNPTGTFIELDVIEHILLNVQNKQLMLMIDESFIDFVSGIDLEQHMERLKAMMNHHQVLIIRSLTKNFMIPGIRVGYAVGSRNIITSMNKLKEPWSINILALSCIPFLLEQQLYLNDLKTWCQTEHDFVLSKLNEIDQITAFEGTANFILFRLDVGSPKQFMSNIINGGVYIRPCDDFEGLDQRFFRIALRNREDNMKLIKLIMEAIL